MRSVIPINAFVTTLANNDTKNLTRGQAAFISSKGVVLTPTTTLTNEEMVKLVVGLGNGKVKEGVILNPKRCIARKKAYVAQAAKTIMFSGLSANIGDAYLGTEVAFTFTFIPTDIYQGELDRPLVFTAVINHNGATETSGSLLTKLKVEVDAVVKQINSFFANTVITTTPANGTAITNTLTVTCAAGYTFEMQLEGAGVNGTKAISTAGVYFNIGGAKQVLDWEQYYDVASIGYNPNFAGDYPKAYGNIFLTEDGATYDIYTLESIMDRTDYGDVGTEGFKVNQVIAVKTGTTVTDFETVLSVISQVSNSITAPETIENT